MKFVCDYKFKLESVQCSHCLSLRFAGNALCLDPVDHATQPTNHACQPSTSDGSTSSEITPAPEDSPDAHNHDASDNDSGCGGNYNTDTHTENPKA